MASNQMTANQRWNNAYNQSSEQTWSEWLWGNPDEQSCGPLVFLSCIWLAWGAPTPAQVMRKQLRILNRARVRLEREERSTNNSIKGELAKVGAFGLKGDLEQARRAAKLVQNGRKRRRRLWKQHDNIRELAEKARQQQTSGEVAEGMRNVIRVMAALNGNVTPEKYEQLMQMQAKIKVGQELREETFDEIVRDSDNDEEEETEEDEAITEILREAGVEVPDDEVTRAQQRKEKEEDDCLAERWSSLKKAHGAD